MTKRWWVGGSAGLLVAGALSMQAYQAFGEWEKSQPNLLCNYDADLKTLVVSDRKTMYPHAVLAKPFHMIDVNQIEGGGSVVPYIGANPVSESVSFKADFAASTCTVRVQPQSQSQSQLPYEFQAKMPGMLDTALIHLAKN